MEEDCGCEINEKKTGKNFFSDQNTVGEEIFEDNDIFDRVKNYYHNFEKDEGEYIDNDLLLTNLIPKKDIKNDLNFINELKNINVKNLEEIKVPKEIIKKEEKEEKEDIIIYDDEKERKIKYIKSYLKKLKDGL